MTSWKVYLKARWMNQSIISSIRGGASTIPSPPFRGNLLIQLRRHSLLSVLVVESDSINLLPKLLVKWSLGTRDCLKFNRQLTFTLGFTVKWQRTWLFFITLACVSSETHNLQRVFRPGRGVLPYMDGLYRYVRRPKGMVFKSFWSEIGYVNWVCFLGEATSSSFGDKTIFLLMFTPTLYVP